MTQGAPAQIHRPLTGKGHYLSLLNGITVTIQVTLKDQDEGVHFMSFVKMYICLLPKRLLGSLLATSASRWILHALPLRISHRISKPCFQATGLQVEWLPGPVGAPFSCKGGGKFRREGGKTKTTAASPRTEACEWVGARRRQKQDEGRGARTA